MEKEFWPPQSSNNIKERQRAIPWLPSSIHHLLFLLTVFFFTTSPNRGPLFLLIFSKGAKWEIHSLGLAPSITKKNPLLSHVDPPESGLCPTLGPQPGPALWHSLARAPPKAGCPQQMGRSSIQSFSTAAPDWMQTLLSFNPSISFRCFPTNSRIK